MKYSVLMPFLPRRPEQVLPYAALVEWTHAHRLWQGQSMLIDAFQGFTAAAGAGFRVPTGLGVTLMPLRHPFEAAQQARSLAMVTGQSVLAGFGPGGVSFQEGLLGSPYASPLSASREYIDIVRGLAAGEEVQREGRYFSCHGSLLPTPNPPVEIGLGVLRPGMARLAGQVADAAISWLTPANYLRHTVLPALRAGAEAAGRPAPRMTAIVPVALRHADREPDQVALASNKAHLAAPHYIDMLARAGVDAASEDPLLNAKRLVEGDAFLYGGEEELTAKFAAFRDAGVDEVVLNLTGVCSLYGPKAAMSNLKTLLAAVDES